MKQTSSAQLNRAILERTIESVEDLFAEAQHAAKLKDWRKFDRLMEQHRILNEQWTRLVT